MHDAALLVSTLGLWNNRNCNSHAASSEADVRYVVLHVVPWAKVKPPVIKLLDRKRAGKDNC
jgi:hypothetical protein